MGRDHCAWIERVDGVERRDPLLPVPRIRFGQVEVDIIVGGITGDYESNGRDMQAGREVRVGMAQFHSDQFTPFEIDDVSLELLSDHQPVRNLVWECLFPDPSRASGDAFWRVTFTVLGVATVL